MNEEKIVDDANESLQNDIEKLDTCADKSLSDSEEDRTEETGENADGDIDYAAVVEEDIKLLKAEFSELASLSDICELNDPLRYAALRDLGLSPIEAYLATAKRVKKDNRSHLVATRTVSVAKSDFMSEAELAAAREIFTGVSDREIRKLYKRVTK